MIGELFAHRADKRSAIARIRVKAERSPPSVVIFEITSHFEEISEFLAHYGYELFYFAAGTLVSIGRGKRDLNVYAIREPFWPSVHAVQLTAIPPG